MKGRLLLDGGRLYGSYFHRTVILICEHNTEGSFGLVLNRSRDKSLGDVVSADVPFEFPESIRGTRLFAGGPVQPATLSYLLSCDPIQPGNVMLGVDVGNDLQNLVDFAKSGLWGKKLRVFTGYAGWAPGQLEQELSDDVWLIESATHQLIFDEDPDQLWQCILKNRDDWKDRLLADTPEDLGWN